MTAMSNGKKLVIESSDGVTLHSPFRTPLPPQCERRLPTSEGKKFKQILLHKVDVTSESKTGVSVATTENGLIVLTKYPWYLPQFWGKVPKATTKGDSNEPLIN